MSPELYFKINNTKTKLKVDKVKNDYFSLGLCLL